MFQRNNFTNQRRSGLWG